MPNLKSHTLISLIFDLLGLKTKYLDSSIGRGNFKRSISYSDQNKKFRDLVNPILIDGIMGFPISINESIDGHKNLTWHKNMQWYEHSRIAYKTYLDILYPALDANVIHLQKYEDIEKNKNQEEIRMIILISTLLVTVSRAIQEIDNIYPSMSPFKNIKNSIESIIKNDYDVYKASKYELKEISSRTKTNISLDIFKKIDKIGGSRNEFPSNEQASKYLEIMQEELIFDEKEKITIENITFELKSKFNSYGFIIRLLKSTEKIGLSGKALVDEIYKTIARIDEKIEKNEYQFSAIDEKNYSFNFKKINGKLDKYIEYFNYLINPRENSNQENLYYPEPFYLCKIDENNKGIVKIHETMNERKVVPIDEIIDIFSKIEFKCNKKDYLLNSLYFIKNNDFNSAFSYINKAKKQKEKSMNIVSKLISIFYIGLNTCKSTKISPNIFDSEIENLNSKTMQSPLIIHCCNVRNSKLSIEKTKDKINYYDFDENLGRANAIRIYNSFILKSEIKSVKFIANPLEKINKSIKKIIKNLPLGTEKDHIKKIIEIEKISLRDISVDYSTIGLDSLAPDALLQYYGLYEIKKAPVFSDINEYIFKFFNMPPELKDYTVNQIITHNKN